MKALYVSKILERHLLEVLKRRPIPPPIKEPEGLIELMGIPVFVSHTLEPDEIAIVSDNGDVAVYKYIGDENGHNQDEKRDNQLPDSEV